MITAARLFGAVATQERPILRTPVIEPKAVFRYDSLAEALERGVGPNAVLVRRAGTLGEFTEAELSRESARDKCVTTRRKLKAIVGQARFAMGRSAEVGEHVHQRQVALTRNAADGVRVFGKVGIAKGKIGQQGAAFLKRRRGDQHEPGRLLCACVEELLVIADENGRPAAPTHRLGAAELEHDHRNSSPAKMLVEGRKADVTRLGMNRV